MTSASVFPPFFDKFFIYVKEGALYNHSLIARVEKTSTIKEKNI
jgi:hypothetical protein